MINDGNRSSDDTKSETNSRFSMRVRVREEVQVKKSVGFYEDRFEKMRIVLRVHQIQRRIADWNNCLEKAA
jgi:hypothetical protein